jgi:putative ABC transport system permease protein
MATYLGVVIALLLGTSALGIFGLAAFNVSTRTKQIGTRRAVGARRTDILRYFLTENWLITTLGVVVGCVLALLLGYWLSTTFELPRLKLYYLVVGAGVLWVVSLVAALRPARRASMVSPAIATRTV